MYRYVVQFHEYSLIFINAIKIYDFKNMKQVGCKNARSCLTEKNKNKADQSTSIASIIKKTTHPTGSKWGAKLATKERFIIHKLHIKLLDLFNILF